MARPGPRTLSLFTGGGGLDVGFHAAGFDVRACVEVDAASCQTLAANRPRFFDAGCRIVHGDIGQIDPASLDLGRCDFIIGGPPCQSFSAAGRRAGGVRGVGDERGSLFAHYCRFIRHFQPKGFLFENVRGILSANKRRDWEAVLAEFSALGYDVTHRVLDAADYGVPQHRERLILVGTRHGVAFGFPRPTHGPDSPDGRAYVAAGEAVAGAADDPPAPVAAKCAALLAEVPPGLNYHFFTREMGYADPKFAWRSRFSDFLYKADPSRPTKTIVARRGAYSGPFHWDGRNFTAAEVKRLFTFPDAYALCGPRQAVLQQLGNSVPPAFAARLAAAVRQQLFDGPAEIELLPPTASLSFDRRKGDKTRTVRTKRPDGTARAYHAHETIAANSVPPGFSIRVADFFPA